jgi:hypothetical protein
MHGAKYHFTNGGTKKKQERAVMSKARAQAALDGVLADRIPQMFPLDSPGAAERVLDFDIWADPERAHVGLAKHFELDMVPSFMSYAEWNFPLVRYYADAKYLDDPSCDRYREVYRSAPDPRPYRSMEDTLRRPFGGAWWGISPTLFYEKTGFDSPEEALAFNPLEHDPGTPEERARFFTEFYEREAALAGDDSLVVGWYYNTLFMWPVEIFGWENFMLAAMLDEERFDEILDQFLEITLRDVTAMCASDRIPAICCHDDLCSAAGPMFSPAWYEEHIFPRYAKVFDVIRGAGKKILYVCDGNLVPLLAPIAATGVDGVMIDHNSDLATVMEAFSGKVVVGGLDPNVVSSGSKADIEKQVRAVVDIVRGEPGYFFQNTGQTGQAPTENILHYQQCLREFGAR